MNMYYCNKKSKKIRSLSVLFFIFSCLPIAFIFILLRHIPKTLPLMEAYVNSGSSFFIPIIPNINLLPEKGQLIRLTLGQLIDIIIIVNVLGFIESSIYHFFKKKYSNEQLNEFCCLDLNCPTIKENLYLSSQEQEDLLGLQVDIFHSLYNNNGFEKNFVKTFKVNEEDLSLYYFHILEQNRKFKNYKKSKFLSYYYNKNNVYSLYLLFKIKNSYLKNIYSLLIINNLPTIFYKDTIREELIIGKISENYLLLKFKIKCMLNSELNFLRKSEKYGME